MLRTNLRIKLRNDVKQNLKEKLAGEFEIKTEQEYRRPLFQAMDPTSKVDMDTDLKFAIEPFSGKGNKDEHLFVGLYDIREFSVY